MDSNETVVLSPLGDVELWYAEAGDSAWRLPLHVEWKQDPRNGDVYGLVLPGTCFYQIQSLAVAAILQRHSLEERLDRWLLPRQKIEALLRKAPGIHAEFYYRWPAANHPPIPSHHSLTLRPRRPKMPKSESFAEYVAGERHIPIDVVNAVLTAISQLGAAWLVEYGRTIDLGFARLMALPFRANWKEIVLWKGKPSGLARALTLRRPERTRSLASVRLPAMLCSPDNVALHGGVLPSARIGYCIEAVADPSFDAEVERVECRRIEQGGYVKRFQKEIEDRYETIVECLAHYAKKVHAAWATVRASSPGGGLAFFPIRAHSVRDVPLSDIPADIIPTGSDFSVFAEGRGKGARQRVALPPSADALQEVSGVPFPTDDMRERNEGG